METEDDKSILCSKPSIKKLAKRGGVKSLSNDCFDPIKNLLYLKLDDILRTSLIINEHRNVRTLSVDDIYEALRVKGINIARTDNLATKK